MSAIDHLTLADIASMAVLSVSPDTALDKAVALMADHRVSSLLILESRRLLGIMTERDILRAMHLGVDSATAVRTLMSEPVLTASPDLDFRSGQQMLDQYGVRHLVLIGPEQEVLGVVTESDFRSHLELDVFRRIQNLSTVMECRNALVAPDTSLANALAHMVEGRLDHVLVTENGNALGILTERDMPRFLARHLDPAQVKVSEVMSSPVLTIPVTCSVAETVAHMAESGVRHMVVLGTDGKMAGVISQHHLLERLGVLLMEDSHSKLESRFSLLLETTGVGTWEYDHEADYLTRSPTLLSMLGNGAEWSSGNLHSWLERVHPDDRRGVLSAFQVAASGDHHLFDTEYRVRREDGDWVWLAVRGRVVRRDVHGQPLQSAGIAVDVNSYKRIEQALEEERSELRRQVDELRRWQDATLGRESRVLELKREVNALLAQMGQPARYASVVDGNEDR